MQVDAPFLKSPDVQTILAALNQPETYFVGGCIRNLLLGVPVTDLDISTILRPDEVIKCAEASGLRAVPTGIDHGTVTVIAGETVFEITTFRKDVETDGRRAVVAFADTIDEDAARRDFTMNALYVSADGVLHDPVNGLPDLEARHFRFIGDAETRIKEDALRILRLFRFHAQYGRGEINALGLQACADNVTLLDTLSRERVGQEMRRLLMAKGTYGALVAMQGIGALQFVLKDADLGSFETGVSLVPTDADNAAFRLALMGASDAGDELRLSKNEQRRLERILTFSNDTSDPSTIGYQLGYEDGVGAVAVGIASGVRDAAKDWVDQVRFGSEQRFPVSATELLQWFNGPDLGLALKKAEDMWIASRFQMSAKDLIESVRPDA